MSLLRGCLVTVPLAALLVYLGCGDPGESTRSSDESLTRGEERSSPSLVFAPVDAGTTRLPPYFPRLWLWDGGEVDAGPSALVVVTGDSLAVWLSRGATWLTLSLGERVAMYNRAQIGTQVIAGTNSMLAREGADLDLASFYPVGHPLPPIRVAVLEGGHNDVHTATPQQIWTGIQQWCSVAHSMGYVSVDVEPPHPIHDPALEPTFAAIVSLLRAQCPCDACIRVWDETSLGAMSCDGTHPCGEGDRDAGGASNGYAYTSRGLNDGEVRTEAIIAPQLREILIAAGMTE